MTEPAPPGDLRLSGVEQGWPDGRADAWLRLFLTLGVVLRLARIGLNHPIWRDEAFLLANLVERDLGGLARPLDYGQVCPIFFLWAEEEAGRMFGIAEWSYRLIPTVASIVSLCLFRHLAGRLLKGEALVLAVAILAIGYTPIRHGGEIKPYSTDFLAALGLIALAVEWLRTPRQVGFLWALAAIGPPALGLSNPAIFVAASLGLVLASPVLRTRSIRAILPWAVFAVGSASTFLVLLRLVNAPQGDNVMSWMQAYWANAFPPRSVVPLLGWLVRAHTSQMFAYPAGGDRGASTLTSVLVLVAIVTYLRRGSRTVLAVLLAPFALGLAASALRRYPYGGSARTMQYVAPAIILMAGLGASVLLSKLPRPGGRERAARLVLVAFLIAGFGMMAWDVSHPYKSLDDRISRDFARRFWLEESRGAELACARSNLKLALNPLVWESERAAFYLCYRAIEANRLGIPASPRLDRVGDSHPLRVVVFNEVPADAATVARWIEENRGRFELRSRRERVLNPGRMQNKASIEDRYVIYELIPAHSPPGRPHHAPPHDAASGRPRPRLSAFER